MRRARRVALHVTPCTKQDALGDAFGGGLGFGERAAVLVIDFCKAYTEPTSVCVHSRQRIHDPLTVHRAALLLWSPGLRSGCSCGEKAFLFVIFNEEIHINFDSTSILH